MKNYLPEGCLINTAENIRLTGTLAGLHEAMASGKILEGRASLCDSEHNIIVDLPCIKGIIPRIEGAMGIESGQTRDIALISKVNKPICFKILSIKTDSLGNETAILSRRIVQEECRKQYIEKLSSGDIIPAKVTHLEQFGCFVDIGCGIPSLIPIDAVSVSRISHPSDRFIPGQNIKVIIKGIDNDRIWLSHKELLGTWQENADMFLAGETVSGTVRSIEDYGIFIELTPNLAGLAEPRENAQIGQHASVYIKAVIPEKMKIKLIIVDIFNAEYKPSPLKYFVNDDHISHWRYPPDSSDKNIETFFDS
jgi:small subunit ribosomal protein S1